MKIKKFFLVSAIVYLLFGIGSILFGWKSQDVEWNNAAASRISILDPYSFYRLPSIAPPKGAPIGYTPFLLILTYLLPFDYRILLFLVDIVNVYLIAKLIRKFKKTIILLLFFSGYFLYASGFVGHPETLIILFSLLSIKTLAKKKFFVSGLCLGLAIASKQSAIFIFIPVVFYLYSHTKKFSNVVKLGVAALISFFLLLSPFLFSNFGNTIYGIFGYTTNLLIRGPNLWWFIDSVLKKVFHFDLIYLFIKISNPMLLFLSIFISFRFKNISLFKLISLNLLLFSIFSKWTSFHYFLVNFVFILLWEISERKGDFPYIWLTYSFLLFSANFILNPLWQLEILLINSLAFLFICFSHFGQKST